MSISLCIIAKNEEESICNTIKSTLNFVDEIILVDTGSKDETISIAKNFDAKIITSPWKNDFSLHRNEAISHASCDWILFLDCDEVLHSNGQEEAKAILKEKENLIKGYNLNIVNMISNKPVASFNSLRLFKNKEGFTFTGAIHEQIIVSIEKKYSSKVISNLPLTILHYGYEDSIIKSKNKIQRNLDILEGIEPKDGYLYAMLGDEYLKGNNYYKAIEFYEKSLKEDSNNLKEYSYMMFINYISSLINIKDFQTATTFLDKTLTELPHFKDLYFLKFWVLFQIQLYKEALILLDKFISFSNSSIPHLEVKRFENIYNLSELRNITLNKIKSQ